jgi:nucleotide-binding universal stress UspA family protein
MKTILVPVDLSAATSRVCLEACKLAKLMGGRALFLHVLPAPVVMVRDYYAFDTGHMAQAITAMEKEGMRKLGAVAARYAKSSGVKVDFAQVVGAPVQEILAKAKSSRASYIVMGSHGHGAMFDLLIGSTTQGVLRKANCPVVIVQPKK